MDDLRALIIGILGGLIVLGLVSLFTRYRGRTLNNDIELLQFEKEHLEAMKRSSVEMNRSSFRAIFTLFFIFGLAHLSPFVFSLLEPVKFEKLSNLVSLILWAIFVGVSYKVWQRYDNLKHYKTAIAKIDAKLEKLQGKLSNS